MDVETAVSREDQFAKSRLGYLPRTMRVHVFTLVKTQSSLVMVTLGERDEQIVDLLWERFVSAFILLHYICHRLLHLVKGGSFRAVP